jgi:hypothetical protein
MMQASCLADKGEEEVAHTLDQLPGQRYQTNDDICVQSIYMHTFKGVQAEPGQLDLLCNLVRSCAQGGR